MLTGRVWTPPRLQALCSMSLGTTANVYPVSSTAHTLAPDHNGLFACWFPNGYTSLKGSSSGRGFPTSVQPVRHRSIMLRNRSRSCVTKKCPVIASTSNEIAAPSKESTPLPVFHYNFHLLRPLPKRVLLSYLPKQSLQHLGVFVKPTDSADRSSCHLCLQT